MAPVASSSRADQTQKPRANRAFKRVWSKSRVLRRSGRDEPKAGRCRQSGRRGPQGSERCAGPGRRSPGENSVVRPHEAGAPLRCSLSPPRCSPLVKVRSPPSDSHRSAPPNDHHRVVAVLMDGYFAEALSQPGPHWVAVALPGHHLRQRAARRPLSPPGGDRGAARRPCRPGRQPARRPGFGRSRPLPENPSGRTTGGGSEALRRATGRQAADVTGNQAAGGPPSVRHGRPLPRRPGTHALGWLSATDFGPRIPHDINPGGDPSPRRSF